MNPSLFSAEGLSGVVFLGFVGLIASGALIATHTQRLIRAISGLALCLLGVAGMYYFLLSPFLALMELLIYVGAVCVLIVFGIMLAEPKPEQTVGKLNMVAGVVGVILGGVLFWGLVRLAQVAPWQASAVTGDFSLEAVGTQLLTSYSMVFELISIVLLVAIIGSVALARMGRERSKA
ncbi:MAG: NADH-quinone oxidoreductase subunit J [Desulfobacteraceae bacterium]|nr:NADH-quinone oxidoreductase subunit J [Desulfobacteraceae bacterium]